MRPRPDEVLHFSEDPTITRFVPHIAPTSSASTTPYVWAVDHARAQDYWFPRQCPRAMAWVGPGTTDADRDRIVGVGCGPRVHAIEYAWVERFLAVELYAYRLPAAPFGPVTDGPEPSAVVATVPVEPLGPPERVPDLLRLHHEAGIQLRILANLWEFWDEVVASSVSFSGIRLRNAAPDPSR